MSADGFAHVIRSERDRGNAAQDVYRTPLGWRIQFKPPTRSLLQNDCLWAHLDDVSAQVEWYGQKLTSEEWKCVFTAALTQQKVVPGIEGGLVAIGARTSKMSISEMSDLIELIRAFGAERGVHFRDMETTS